MSGASNLGYGNTSPFSNINDDYVNIDNSNSPATFGSNEVSGTPPGPLPGLAGTKNNVDAAAGVYPGRSILIKGGAKKLKRKIKNITKHYKMKGGSKRRNSLRKKLKSKYASKSSSKKSRRNRRVTRRQRGGYSQYQNNLPMTPSYQVAGINLPVSELALANPAPYTMLSNSDNCVDNYNHYLGTGFPSRGH